MFDIIDLPFLQALPEAMRIWVVRYIPGTDYFRNYFVVAAGVDVAAACALPRHNAAVCDHCG